MAYKSDSFMFKSLNDAEEKEFRDFCHKNEPNLSSWLAFHPVCRDEWTKLGKGPKTVEGR